MRMGMMRIPCKDLAESEIYYTHKLGLTKKFGSPEDGYVGFSLENIDVLIELEERGEFECGRFLGFSLVVDDIDTVYKNYMEKGITFTGPPQRQFWGGVMTHIVDCSGNSFSLVQETKNA